MLTVREVAMDGRPAYSGRGGDTAEAHSGIPSPPPGRRIEDGTARALLLR